MPIRGKSRRFTDKNISNSPTDGGVYSLSKRGEVVYIGKGNNADGVRNRLQAAKRGDTPGVKSATSFQAERSKKPAEREKQLLEQYKKQHGKLPRYNDRIG